MLTTSITANRIHKGLIMGTLLGALTLGLAACETTEGYRQRMTTWEGRHSDNLLIEWGTPVDKATLSDGNQVWVYSRVTENRSGGYWTQKERTRVEKRVINGQEVKQTVTYSEPYYEPEKITRNPCETRFIIGKDSRIVAVSFEGPGCVAEEVKK